MAKLILIRHGQSLWNLQNRFTGWIDVPLTELGYAEARKAADRLRGIQIDVAYTSALSRAQETLREILDRLALDVPVIRDQALNERHYGQLQGLNKEQTAQKYGADQIHIWRRS